MVDIHSFRMIFCDKQLKLNFIGFLVSLFIMIMCVSNLSHLFDIGNLSEPRYIAFHTIGLIGLYLSIEATMAFVVRLYRLNLKRRRLK